MLHPFGRELRRLRQERHVRLFDMAKRLDLSPSRLCEYEKGYDEATPAMLKEIALMLSLPAEEVDALAVAAGQPLRSREADRRYLEAARSAGLVFTSYQHQEGNPACPCNSCRYERSEL